MAGHVLDVCSQVGSGSDLLHHWRSLRNLPQRVPLLGQLHACLHPLLEKKHLKLCWVKLNIWMLTGAKLSGHLGLIELLSLLNLCLLLGLLLLLLLRLKLGCVLQLGQKKRIDLCKRVGRGLLSLLELPQLLQQCKLLLDCRELWVRLLLLLHRKVGSHRLLWLHRPEKLLYRVLDLNMRDTKHRIETFSSLDFRIVRVHKVLNNLQ